MRRLILKGMMLGTLALTAAAAYADLDGRKLYEHNCEKCHGQSGKADTWRGYLYFAEELADPKWQAKQTDADLRKSIERGPRIMPSFRDEFSDEEMVAVIGYVRSLRAK